MQLILEILLVAISFTILLSWGYVKQQRKTEDLLKQLYRKSEKMICARFKKEDILTLREVEQTIKDTKASLFWTRKHVQIKETKYIASDLMQQLENKGTVALVEGKGPKRYRLV